jgi:hypothetical protein
VTIAWIGSRTARVALEMRRPDEAAEAVAGVARALVADSAGGEGPLGVYAATGNAGAAQATALWTDALAGGPAFANPAPFPWALAGSVAAQAATAIGARGPNVTLAGGAAAMVAALSTAVAHFDRGRIAAALLLAVDVEGQPAAGVAVPVVAVYLSRRARAGAPVVARADAVGASQAAMGSASSALARVAAAVEAGRQAIAGDPREGWFLIRAVPER